MMKGAKRSESGEIYGYAYTEESTVKIDELVAAPFLVFRFPSGGVTPFLQVGPELGFNVSKKYTAEVTVEGVGSESSSGTIEEWSSINFGVNLGGGAAIPAGKGEVVFDARYNLGLKNMSTYDPLPGEQDETIKTNGIQFLVGYNFSVPAK